MMNRLPEYCRRMEHKPSATDNQTLVCSFLKIAIGETIEIAQHFLEAGKWRVEDALELFYMKSEGQLDGCASSCVEDELHPSILNDSTFGVCLQFVPLPSVVDKVIISTLAPVELPPTVCGFVPATISSASPEFVTRHHRHSPAEITADVVAGATPSNSNEFITCRHRRTRAEMAMDTSSITIGSMASTSSSRGARRPRRTTNEISVVVVQTASGSKSFGVQNSFHKPAIGAPALSALVPQPDVATPTSHRRTRTRAEMNDASVMIATASTSSRIPLAHNKPLMDGDVPIHDMTRRSRPRVNQRAGTGMEHMQRAATAELSRPPVGMWHAHSSMDIHTPIYESSTRKTPRRRTHSQPLYAGVGLQNLPVAPLALTSPTTCVKCGAKKFAFETMNLCCQDGQVHLSSNDFPHALIDLFQGDSNLATHFQQYVRVFNNFFAFSSLGGDFDTSTEKGIHVFSLHGQLYHYLPNLIPPVDNPNYLQMYFYDGALENDIRMARFSNFDADIVSILMTVMNINPYAHFFRSLRDVNTVNDSRVVISRNPVLDQRVYNAPTSNQVAAILADGTNSPEINNPYITVVGKSDRSHRVMHYYGCYDPLQYPLLFPTGNSGWHQGLKRVSHVGHVVHQNITFPVVPCLVQNEEDLLQCESEAAERRPPKPDKEVSCREYFAYKLQVHDYNYILFSVRLLQQYIVDMYVKIENTRLDFFRRHQSTTRSELYQGVVDSLNEGHRSVVEIGKKIILHASYIGGPRDMNKRYLNAMNLVQRFGKPYLFITITCNPRWLEIQRELQAREKVENGPELCARIFNAKLKLLKMEIVDKHIFGSIVAKVHVVEFQKRGLPHAHMLVILSPQNKIVSQEDFDKYVVVEILGEDDPTLSRMVLVVFLILIVLVCKNKVIGKFANLATLEDLLISQHVQKTHIQLTEGEILGIVSK